MSLIYAIVGSRNFNCKKLLYDTLNDYNISLIVSGGAKGADSLAEEYAKDNNIPTKIFLLDWSKGRSAGIQRNHNIILASDAVIAFWDGKSKGTEHSINLAKKYKKMLLIIKSFD